ncbi:MAG: GrpB family protein [Acidimicrobiia bacterium]
MTAVRYPRMELVGSGSWEPVEVVRYDHRWPAAFESWHLRLVSALGKSAIRVEHVGSTAVPGLAAKPVVDVQVSVPDVEDEGAYLSPIESLGVPLRSREPGHRYFRPPPGTTRDVQIHVCDAGSEWERDHLLFRDYLRAHPEAREAYARLKVALAERYRSDRLAYNEAKAGFILDTLEAAREWAGRTCWGLSQGR